MRHLSALMFAVMAATVMAAPMEYQPVGKLIESGSKSLEESLSRLGLDRTHTPPPSSFAFHQILPAPPTLQLPARPGGFHPSGQPPTVFEPPHRGTYEYMPPTPHAPRPGPIRGGSGNNAASESSGPYSRSRQRFRGLVGKVIKNNPQPVAQTRFTATVARAMEENKVGSSRLLRQPHLSPNEWEELARSSGHHNTASGEQTVPTVSRDMSRFNDGPDGIESRFNF